MGGVEFSCSPGRTAQPRPTAVAAVQPTNPQRHGFGVFFPQGTANEELLQSGGCSGLVLPSDRFRSIFF